MKFSTNLELAYLDLINEVASVNPKAAVYMLTDMRKVPSFEPCGQLSAIVFWDQTEQGTDYWFDIMQQIGQTF
jgi:hypothetical protein